ncbi:MAG TPA: leucine--tRNA ligase [bacterium]|nr:leucine--tRNA ligase [bacterium]
MEYRPAEIEPKWQKRWIDDRVFSYRGKSSDKPKYYMLEMFPYPSGRIHMGHVRNYSIGDVVARYWTRRGFNVLHPIGWDAFGLPAENAAIEHKTAPAVWTYKNIDNMKSQLKKLGFSYDWEREIATCRPEYYRWEQLFFIEMWEKGLVYKKESEVNWCEKCATVLANEQVEEGVCWRCDSTVTKKKIDQWFFKITAYADELLRDLDNLPGWPEHVKEMQRNWIGKSEGAYIDFATDEGGKLTVFTTRPDTLMGVTFVSMAVEHPLAEEILAGAKDKHEMAAFIEEVKSFHAANVRDDNYEKKGYFTGRYLTHPVTGAKVPLYFANFVLAGYGTGVVMAVPAHDQRDFEFAQKYGLPIKVVIEPTDKKLALPLAEAYTEPGIMVDSGEFTGTPSEEGKKKVSQWLVAHKKGAVGINFRLRDWGISRQRYWGCPVPMVKCEKCGMVPVKKSDLPVRLPEDVRFSGVNSPIKSMPSFYETTCPTCGGKAIRETDTMDTFVESSWYHLRYCDPHNDKAPFDKGEAAHTMPVDQYIGGVEHAVMHLLYTRFFTKVLADLGYVPFREPVKNLLTQGMVCMESYKAGDDYLYPEEVEWRDGKPFSVKDGAPVNVGRIEKMSKSKKNVIDPDKMVAKYGADTARIFILFAAPPEKDLEWSADGVEGSSRFIIRVWNIVTGNLDLIRAYPDERGQATSAPDPVPGPFADLFRKTHQTIQKVRDEIERFHFNTGIAAIMELVNAAYKVKPETDEEKRVFAFTLRTVVDLLNPFAPHITEELYQLCGAPDTLLSQRPYPDFRADALVGDTKEIVVQVNGKVRDKITVPTAATKEEVEAAVRAKDFSKFLNSGSIKKIIYVPDKLLNVVG